MFFLNGVLNVLITFLNFSSIIVVVFVLGTLRVRLSQRFRARRTKGLLFDGAKVQINEE